MFDIGFLEISVIFVVALVVVGPEKLPGLARTVGLYVGKARRYADIVRREIENEVRSAELKELAKKPALLNDVKESITETADVLKSTEKELQQVVEPGGTDSSNSGKSSEASEQTPHKTLGEMARSSWSNQSGPAAVEQPSTGDDTTELPLEKSSEVIPEASTTSSPEQNSDDERRDTTT